MGFFSSLFQSKNHLPPALRALAVYIETQLVGIALTGLMALSQYTSSAQQVNVSGLLTFLWASVAIAVGKAFTGLVPQVQNALVQAVQPASQPPVVVNNNVSHPVASAPATSVPAPQRPQFTPLPQLTSPFPVPTQQ